MAVAKQSSIMDKMKSEMGQMQTKAKSPYLPKSPKMRKSHKIGKENQLQIVSPLRERNH